MKHDLTVIIPFLNEGIEVFNTVESIRNTSEDVGIILINDASTDGYDYRSVAEKFDTVYIEHSERKGVAASRDEGVEMCETEYFILLDAHMRFYQNDWVDMITQELDKDQRVVLCSQTVVLNKTADNEVIKKDTKSFGVYINFSTPYMTTMWNNFDIDPDSDIIDIPCILGAGYALSKKYWLHLLGLKGLKSYGSDEQLLSIKAWLEGGRCRLLKKLKIGHIYRTEMPYEKINAHRLFNYLLIYELFLPGLQKETYISKLRQSAPKSLAAALPLIGDYAHSMEEERNYYGSIFSKDRNIEQYIQYNRTTKLWSDFGSFFFNQQEGGLYENFIKSTFSLFRFYNKKTVCSHLFWGKCAALLCLYKNSSYITSDKLEEFTNTVLDDIFEKISAQTSLNFSTGLLGIAYCIHQLINVYHVELDADDFYSAIDSLVQNKITHFDGNLEDCEDFTGEIIYYLIRHASDSAWRCLVIDFVEKIISSVNGDSRISVKGFSSVALFLLHLKEKATGDPQNVANIYRRFMSVTQYVGTQKTNSIDTQVFKQIVNLLKNTFAIASDVPLNDFPNEPITPDVSSSLDLFDTAVQIAIYRTVLGDNIKFQEDSSEIRNKILSMLSDKNDAVHIFDKMDRYGVFSVACLGLLNN